MANAFTQYLKDTRSELNHVAWPTQTQTVVFTALVALISLGIAAYLGIFDFLFTTSLAKIVTSSANSSSGIQVTQLPASAPAPTQSSGTGQINLGVPGVQVNQKDTTNTNTKTPSK